MRILALYLAVIFISGCGYYLSFRPGIMERKIKLDTQGGETHRYGVLATAADYRVVVFRGDKGTFCSEASPDAVAQLAQNFATSLKGPAGSGSVAVQAQVTMAATMVQLTRRSQGLQFFRDGAFEICNLVINEQISKVQALYLMDNLRETSAKLIEAEVAKMGPLVIYAASPPAAEKLLEMDAAPAKASTAGSK